MRTITIEEHFQSQAFTEAMNRATSGRGASEVFIAGRLEKLRDLGSLRLQDMDASGIDLQVISHTASGMVPLSDSEYMELTRKTNDQLAAAITAHPDRFAGFAMLPMIDPKAAASELERAVRSLGFKGAMINGTSNGRFLDDPAFLPVLEQAAALDVPIYIHPGEPPEVVQEAYYTGFDAAVSGALSTAGWGWHSEVGIHALRLILAGVFDRLPTLQIIIGHMGEMVPFMLYDRINSLLGPAVKHLQRPLPEYFLQNFHFTTSGFFSYPPLLLALQVVGVDRIIFSIDYPYSSNDLGRAFLDSIPLSPADKEKISHLNAERVLKLPGAPRSSLQ